jgi:hypothetical protein
MQMLLPKAPLASRAKSKVSIPRESEMGSSLLFWVPMSVIPLLVTILLGNMGRASPLSDSPLPSEIDSDLRKLLDAKTADLDQVRTFMQCLSGIAKKRSWEDELTKWERLTGAYWDDARVNSIQSGDSKLYVVLLKSWSHDIPGSDYQIVLLLDNQGRYLDSVGCSMNARLSRNGRGKLHAVIPPKPEADGAQLIVRLDGESARGGYGHHIYHGKERLDLHWAEKKPLENQPSEWDAKGLCRIAIKDKKFQVLFPAGQWKKRGK